MKIAVMGAGAVGCYFGALLAKAGHELVMIGRAAHVEAMNARGLLLERAPAPSYVLVTASALPEAVAGAELVLVCVKSADTETASEAMLAYLAPEAVIVSLQNGVGNAQGLAAVLGRPVLPAGVYLAAEMAGPGHVRHNGRGELVLGQGPGVEALAVLLREAAIPTTISADVEAVLWTKLVLNCAYNAISAMTQAPYGQIVAVAEVETLIRNVVAECEAVAAACGVSLPRGQAETVLAAAQGMAGQLSSTAQDLMRGRRTEIEYLNGHIVRLGVAQGIPTPVNQALLAVVKVLETRVGEA